MKYYPIIALVFFYGGYFVGRHDARKQLRSKVPTLFSEPQNPNDD